MGVNHKFVDYYLPSLGRRVNAVLYSNASICYDLLENYNHITRLKRIEQLGVISKVYKTAYHSRWEYVMLHLHLLHQLNEEENGLGLRNTKIESGKYKASGIEILQLWVLLFNSGHLPGTFATERAVIRFLKKDEIFKKMFSEGLPKTPDNIKKEFEKSIEHQNIFTFHRILISFYLNGYKKDFSRFKTKFGFRSKSYEDPEYVDFLQEIINFYETKKDKRLLDIFKNLRLLSYLFLDSQHVKFPISFDLSELLLNFPYHIHEIIKEPNSQIIRTLNSFEDFLSLNMYHSADSIREIGYHAGKIEDRLINDRKNFNKPEDILDYLNNDEKLNPRVKKWGNSLNFYLLFDFNYPDFWERLIFVRFFDRILYKIENEWNNDYKNICQFTYQQGSNNKHLVINLSFSLDSPENKNLELISEFLKIMIIVYANLLNEFDKAIKDKTNRFNEDSKELLEKILKKPYSELIILILKYIVKKELFFEFDDNYPDILAIHEKSHIIKAQKRIEKEFSTPKISRSRKNELKVIKNVIDTVINETIPKIILPLSQLHIYDYTQDSSEIQLAEIDGIAIGIFDDKLTVLLVEAKKQARGSAQDSKSALLEKLDKIKFKTSKKWEIKKINNGAYCCLEIDGGIFDGKLISQ